MPLHDWTRVPAGLLQDFHQSWSIRLKDALNSGLLPRAFAALVEQRAGPRESDVLAIEDRERTRAEFPSGDGVATMERPSTRIVRRSDREFFAGRANRIVVRHHLGRIVAAIEIVSPGNKDSRAALREFVAKTIEFLRAGVHVLVIDLFPPTPRDPLGIHKAIWDEILEEPFELPRGKDRILVSYETSAERVAYIEPLAVGDELPDMPLFLAPGWHVQAPLEPTYLATWRASPEALRVAVEKPASP